MFFSLFWATCLVKLEVADFKIKHTIKRVEVDTDIKRQSR